MFIPKSYFYHCIVCDGRQIFLVLQLFLQVSLRVVEEDLVIRGLLTSNNE